MTKHTPAPWRIHVDPRNRGYEVMSDLRSGTGEICRINSARSGAKRGQAVRFWEHPDDAANAKLISAAPDLLDALQAARYELWHQWHATMDETKFNNHPLILNMDAAIAKATNG